MQRVNGQVWRLLETVVDSMGVEFVGAVFGQAENGQTLRVYIDKPEGVLIDDCALVSRQLSAMLDVEDVIEGEYLLEVSSPGMDRPLFDAGQFARVIGQKIRVRMLPGYRSGTAGDSDQRRNFKGLLVDVAETGDIASQTIEMDVNGENLSLPIAAIESARLVPDY